MVTELTPAASRSLPTATTSSWSAISAGGWLRCSSRCCDRAPGDAGVQAQPDEEILADRGNYIAACLTICRAYAAAGRPNRLPQLASYGEWSDTVRSALVWLGEADPVKSQDKSHADDPEAIALLTVLNEWKAVIGAGEANAAAVRDVIVLLREKFANANGWQGIRSQRTAQAVLAVMPVLHSLKPDATGSGLLAALQEGPADRQACGSGTRRRPAIARRCGGWRRNRPRPVMWPRARGGPGVGGGWGAWGGC